MASSSEMQPSSHIQKKSPRPGLEKLEDRTVPALVVRSLADLLYISGTPKTELFVEQTGAANNFSVRDGSKQMGQYTISRNLLIRLRNRPDGDVNIDLNDGAVPGNVNIDLGKGCASNGFGVDIYDNNAGAVGSIGGSVMIYGGKGNETYNIGAVRTAPFTADPRPINIGGDLTVVGVNSPTGVDDNFNLDAGTTVGGNIRLAQVDAVAIGRQAIGAVDTTVRGNLTIVSSSPAKRLSVVISGSIYGNVSVLGNSQDDVFTFQLTDSDIGGVIRGNLFVNFGDSASNYSEFNLIEDTTVMGSVTLISGYSPHPSLGDYFNIRGNILGSLVINMGDGINDLNFAVAAVVSGNVSIIGGNGQNNIGCLGNDFLGTIGGNLTINLGNGNNGSSTDPMVIAPTALNGRFTWRSGNGDNYLQLGNGVDLTLFADIVFGDGNDTLDTNLGAGFFRGRVNGGGGTNTFTMTSGSFDSPIRLLNI